MPADALCAFAHHDQAEPARTVRVETLAIIADLQVQATLADVA